MDVYLDGAFMLNAVVDYLLLAGSARLCGTSPRRARLLLAAGLGGVYAALGFLPGLDWLTALPCRMAVLVLLVVLAFGAGHRLPMQGALFVLLSLAMCGLLLALSSLLQVQVWLLDGRAYYAVGFGSLILTAGATYCVAWLLLQGTAAHTSAELLPAVLRMEERESRFTVLYDTGNTLRDPFTGRGVPVVSWRAAAPLMPQISADQLQRCAAQPVWGVEQLAKLASQCRARLIPYRAVGTQSGMLLAIWCDEIQVGKRSWGRGLVAISPTELSDGGGYEGLTGGAME